MKIVEIQDVKNSTNLIIIVGKAGREEYKQIENIEKKTLILLQEESDLKLSGKLLSSNPNIIAKKFSWNIFKQKHYYRYLSCFDANNFLKIFLEKQFKKNQRITNFIGNLYKDKKLENAFKKQTLNHIKKKFEVKIIFEKLLELNPKISLVNKSILNDNYFDENFVKSNTTYFSTIFYKLKNLFYFIFYPLYVIFVLIFYTKYKSNCSIALRIYGNGLRMNDYDYNIDWIKKENVIPEKDILLVIEDTIDKNFLNSLKKSPYTFTYSSKKKPLGNFSLKISFKIFILFFKSLFKILQFFKAPIFYQDILLNAWINFFIWNNFLTSHSPRVYLSYHDYLDNHIYRNILLNKKNCKSISYKHTNSENLFDLQEKYLRTEFAYNYFDLEIHWIPESIKMSKSCYSQSKKFILSPPLWSSKEFINKNLIIKDLNIKTDIEKKKIISVFSAGFGSRVFNSVESHYFLLKFLKKILEKRRDTFIFFKPKYDIELLNGYHELKNLIDYLNDNKMCKVINKVRSINLINVSDLTISMTFASPTMEAVASGKKGFYVDLTNDYPNSPCKNINNFVATSIPDALNKVEYWLSIDNKQFLNFLNNDIKYRFPLNLNNESIENMRSIVLNEISKKTNI